MMQRVDALGEPMAPLKRNTTKLNPDDPDALEEFVAECEGNEHRLDPQTLSELALARMLLSMRSRSNPRRRSVIARVKKASEGKKVSG
jgi:hypothetical protein